ncbi:hypothetical protein [Turneriella parva]|uniref:Uncharacterized protein n=1 Tax=Turneriella parva (strain ATCC BAA-1111 / DSM 21527 / NCTC 11395 / H) TaxID=869212 RepID=I4B301_TURPD|nr:hypothetical protein [Turneriella parva]AFM11658.1 hypothetical protein Turpa_1009 [Turneriella parva DSM 21527]
MIACWHNLRGDSPITWLFVLLFAIWCLMLQSDLRKLWRGIRSGKMPLLGARPWAEGYHAVDWQTSRARYIYMVARNLVWLALLCAAVLFTPWALCHLTPRI